MKSSLSNDWGSGVSNPSGVQGQSPWPSYCQAILTALSLPLLFVALTPSLATLMLGAPPLSAADPATLRAASATLQAGGIALAIGWPAGVAAAFGIWGARPAARVAILAGAWLAVSVAIAQPGGNLTGLLPMAAPVAGAASVALLILTAALNGVDPRLLATSAAAGARPAQAWLTVLACLRTPLILAAAAGVAFAMAVCTGLPGRPALAGLLHQAVRQHDVTAAPDALLLAALSLLPLAAAGCALLLARAFRRP